MPHLVLILSLMTGIASASPVEKAIPKISSDDFQTRNKAQAELLTDLKKGNSKEQLETNMQELFQAHFHTKDPELYDRLYQVMKKLAPQYKEALGSGFLGIEMTSSGISLHGDYTRSVRIMDVQPDSAAAKAGLKKGDHIISIGGQSIPRSGPKANDFLIEVIKSYVPGETTNLTYVRSGEQHTVKVTFSGRDDVKAKGWQKLKNSLQNGTKKLLKAGDKNAKLKAGIGPNIQILGDVNQLNIQVNQNKIQIQGGRGGVAWEHVDFGSQPDSNKPPTFFQRWYKRQVTEADKQLKATQPEPASSPTETP